MASSKLCLFLCCIFYCLSFLGGVGSLVSERCTALERRVGKQGPVLSLTFSEYKNYVVHDGRDYRVALLIIAGSSMNCAQCDEAAKIFEHLARAYRDQGHMRSTLDRGALPIFFIKMDLSQAMSLATYHDLRVVPVLAFIEPDHNFTEKRGKGGKLFTPFPSGSEIQPSARMSSYRDFVTLGINDKSGYSPSIKTSAAENFLASTAIVALTSVVVLFVYFSLKAMQSKPYLMGIGALGIYGLATSGLCWVIIHKAPWWGYDRRSGSRVLIAQTKRQQYGVEGLVMSALVLSCSAFLLIASNFARTQKKKPRAWIGVMSMLFLILSLVVYFLVHSVDSFKQGLGHTSFFPPSHFVKGPLMRDRGNVL